MLSVKSLDQVQVELCIDPHNTPAINQLHIEIHEFKEPFLTSFKGKILP